MTPEERKEAVAMLRRDAAYNAERANLWNDDEQGDPTELGRETAWMHATRANLLTLAADEIERAGAESEDV